MFLCTGKNSSWEYSGLIFLVVISVCFVFRLRLLISNKFFLFQQFRLGCRTFWRGCGTGPGD
jgi:hypothetical protein